MMYETSTNDIISIEELCKRLMISESTAYKLLKQGAIPGVFKLVSHWKIPAQAVGEFIALRRKK